MYNVYIRIAKDRREVEKLKRMHSELFFLFLCRIEFLSTSQELI